MVCLREEVCEREAQVERRVTQMRDFVVDQNQLFIRPHEDVLGAEIAVDEGFRDRVCFQAELVEERGGRGKLSRGVLVVRLEAKASEMALVPELGLELVQTLTAPEMDAREDLGESFDVGVLDVSAEQHVLPVLVRLRHGGH